MGGAAGIVCLVCGPLATVLVITHGAACHPSQLRSS